MAWSLEDVQRPFADFLGLLSAKIPADVAGVTLAMWTIVGVLAVRLAVYITGFILKQVKFRWAMKQFHENPPTRRWPVDYYEDHHVHWFGPFLAIVVCAHPDTIKPILSNITKKTDFAYRAFRPWLGDGLLVSEGQKWRRNRRLLTPAFHFDILKNYVTQFSESTTVLLDKWLSRGPGASVDVFEHIGLMTLDIILKCSLGYNSGCQTDGMSSPYILAVDELTKLVDERVDYPLYHIDFIYYLTASGRRFRKACNIVHSFSEQVIRKRKEEMKKATFTSSKTRSGKGLDLLDVLLQAKDEDGTGLSVSEIRDEVNTFLFGGHHTTASGISWTLFHLAKHKQYQDKCREEVEAVLQGRNEMIWSDVGKLPFITMCIKESMRCATPVPRSARTVKEDFTFATGRWLPRGAATFADFNGLHGNEEIWPNPSVYDPYRFSPENSKNRHPYAFLPFSSGPRNCIGQNFAMNEMKVAVALILQRFHLELDATKPPPVPCDRLTLQAEDGIWMNIFPVETAQ